MFNQNPGRGGEGGGEGEEGTSIGGGDAGGEGVGGVRKLILVMARGDVRAGGG